MIRRIFVKFDVCWCDGRAWNRVVNLQIWQLIQRNDIIALVKRCKGGRVIEGGTHKMLAIPRQEIEPARFFLGQILYAWDGVVLRHGHHFGAAG
ncbi:hypothetical protein D3C81_1794150 [compost metagenome]